MTSTVADVAAFSARISAQTVWTFVRVRDAAGRAGWGEATLTDQAAAVHAHVERLAPILVGQPLRSPPTDLAAKFGRVQSIAEAAATSAIDQALWDVTAQAKGRSLARMLGDARRTTIPLYANINRGTRDRSAAGFAARALEAMRCGFDAMKIAPFDGVRPDMAETTEGRRLIARGVERIAAVRSAIGPHVRLLVDCHWRLTEASARSVLREVEPARLHWFECPLIEEPFAFPALRRLRAEANAQGVRLAGCETMTSLDAFRSFLDAGVYDVVMPDVKYVGGLIEMLRIGEAAAAADALCSPHNPTGPISHLHSVHVSTLLSAFPFLEFQYGESPLFFDIVDGDLPDTQQGASRVPDSPGIGRGIDMAKLRPRLVADTEG
jgi:galactonate dehydratase